MGTYKNAAGFSPEKIKLLEEDLAGLDEAGSHLAERAVRYIVDGEDAEVLDALARAHNPAEQIRLVINLRLFQGHRAGSQARAKFFATIEPVGHVPYLRLAKVYEAAAKGGPPVQLLFQAYYGGLPWLELFLRELAMYQGIEPEQGFPFSYLEQMLADEGQDAALLIKAVFSAEPQDNMRLSPVTTMKARPGFRESVVKHRAVAADALVHADPARRVELLGILRECKVPPELFTQELVLLAVSGTKKVRDAAAPLLSQVRQQARPLMEQAASEGSPTERATAVQWLGRFGGEAAKEFLLARQQAERAKKVQEAISDALGEVGQSPVVEAEARPTSALPRLPPVEVNVPLTAEARRVVAELIEAYNRTAAERNRLIAAQRQQHPTHRWVDLPIYDSTRADEVCGVLESATDLPSMFDRDPLLGWQFSEDIDKHLERFAAHPDVRLIHLVRLLGLIGSINSRSSGRMTMFMMRTEAYLRRFHEQHTGEFTLRHLAAVLEAVGLDGDIPGCDLLSAYVQRPRWMAPYFEPYFCEHVELLMTALDNRPLGGRFDFEWRGARERALDIISKFSALPPKLIAQLWSIAIGSAKTGRAAAQQIMERAADIRQRLADALAGGDHPTRAIAAEWLGRLEGSWAVPLLHKAAAKEKQDTAKDAMLTALERLGESIDRYLDRDQLLADAERGLQKGLHKDLAWFPVNSWPDVHWHDSGELVSMELLNWFLAQTNKLGSPEPGALLRRYCQQFAADDRAAAGMFVLRSWIEHDTRRKYTDAQARNLAKQQAMQAFQMFRNAPPGAGHMAQYTLEQWEDLHYKQVASECVGSAIKQKGILALAASCCGDEAVEAVDAYLKKWYGYRAAQCRALIALLASLDRPSAVQLLLSVANRFRTKSIRGEAEKYVKLVAERKGWTVDELADRTVPTAGFDENLALELDYGPRQITARLRPDLTIGLTDESGKPLKSLPEPRKDDDDDKAKAAKKALSTAKSDLKKLVAQQTARLYEAMCTERTWCYADWETYLYRHPIVRQLCQRLVWGVVEGNQVTKTFRPLDDGTLTDEQDGQVTLPSESRLRLAHGSLVSGETSAAWLQHFADYEVEPLFMQFGRDRYVIAEAKQDAAGLTDFEGHLIEAFKLRGQATRLGYTRGPTRDGGWFYDYEKTLTGMGMKVVIRFSGNGMPEENRTVALLALYFAPTAVEPGVMAFEQPGIPLRDVPGVLLSECYHDLATIAAAGTGYDADWRKKVEM
ncbi:MAG TPA: DUF4132 domain-containing protein [Pirellulales bacterium]|nr:DUF4132 domain-containing protein [Pirellulales bacterium]